MWEQFGNEILFNPFTGIDKIIGKKRKFENRPYKISKSHIIDIREIDSEYFNPIMDYPIEEIEWFRKPIEFIHFKNRIDLLDSNSNDFYQILKYKILNLIPTLNEELTENVYKYLFEKFDKEELNRIITRCAKYRREMRLRNE